MKKVLSMFLSLVMLLSITTGLDFSSYANVSGNYYYTVIDDGTVAITNYNGNNNDLEIPSKIDGYIVTEIGSFAFYLCVNLTSVTIPNSVTSIGDSAFFQCVNLTSVTIPSNITNIENYAFSGCTNLASITIPTLSSVISIGKYAFSSCSNLTNITMGNGVISIGEGTFEYCESLTSITIPNSVTSIGYYAFDECENLKDVYYFGTKDQWNKIRIGSYNECLTSATIHYNYKPPHFHTSKTTTTKATASKNGSVVTKCSVCGNVSKKTTIYYPKTITLSATSYTYDGKVKKPIVTVKDSKGNKIASNNYTVTYASGRKSVGKYTVTIKFKSNYSGTVKKTFTIKPKATSISKLTAGKKKFTVKWKKQATQTTGYQIQYSTNSNFKNAKTVTASKNSTTSKTISKLSAKKKYYVRIRTYKTVNGTKIYSSWSKSKTVKTK